MENNDMNYEEKFLQMKKEKEEADKKMLMLEIVLGFTALISFFTLLFVALYIKMPNMISSLLITIGLIIFIVAMFFGLKIEQIAGYYECKKCGNRYVPKYKDVFFSMHIGRTRYLRCPKCNKRSWNKKVITK